jgi:hypothetical protein
VEEDVRPLKLLFHMKKHNKTREKQNGRPHGTSMPTENTKSVVIKRNTADHLSPSRKERETEKAKERRERVRLCTSTAGDEQKKNKVIGKNNNIYTDARREIGGPGGPGETRRQHAHNR